jgi:16S rRNA (adenine1518-N6/adenine1519-N6)-dimethyltransferase
MPANLTSKKTVKLLLKEHGVRPGRQMGQNFLVDRKALKKFVQAVDARPKDVILEVGPGLGVITQELAQRAKRVIAVEKDQKLAEILKENLKGSDNLKIITGDILKLLNTLCEIQNTDYKVAANLPFNVASAVIRQFLEAKKPPTEMVFFVQKEVGQRICALPPKANFLAIFVRFYAQVMIAGYVSKKSFWPEPKVDTVIIKIIISRKQLTRSEEHTSELQSPL